jgi:hypothetical protein
VACGPLLAVINMGLAVSLPGDGLGRLRSAASTDCAIDEDYAGKGVRTVRPILHTRHSRVCVYLSVLTTRVISLSVLTIKFGNSGAKVVRIDRKAKKWSEVIGS